VGSNIATAVKFHPALSHGTWARTIVTPSRASKSASGSRGWLARKSVGEKKRPTPHFTCCRPAVTNTVRAMSKASQAWSSSTAGLLAVVDAGIPGSAVPPTVVERNGS
jgi:hypothetical protein